MWESIFKMCKAISYIKNKTNNKVQKKTSFINTHPKFKYTNSTINFTIQHIILKFNWQSGMALFIILI